MEEMLNKFKEAALEEPTFMPFGVGECIINIISRGPNQIPRGEKAIQSTVNNYMCKVGKRYNKKLAILVPTQKDNFIYDSSRLFPISTYEWILSSLELYAQHYIGLSWLGKKIYYKSCRILEERYGQEYKNEIVDIIKVAKKESKMNWNVTLYEFIETYVTGMKDRETKIERIKFSKEFTHILLSTFYFTWGAKEITDMTTMLSDFAEKFNVQTASSVIYLSLVSFIGPRSDGAGRNR